MALTAASAYAVPAKPGLLQYSNADGTTVNVTLHGDEFGHYYLSEDGYPLIAGSDHNLYYVDFTNGKPQASAVRVSDIAHRPAAEAAFLKTLDREKLTAAVADNISMTQTAMRAKANPAGRRNARPMQAAANAPVTGLITNYPTIGSPNAMILLVQFEDVKFSVDNPHQAFEDLINQENYSANGGTGSAKDYYVQNSNGLFTPNFEVYGPITVPKGEAYYGASTVNTYDIMAWQMVADAVQKLHEEQPDLDWSRFDNDGDGYVDSIFVFYAGYGQNEGAPEWTIWPHSYNLSYAGIDIEYNGVKIDNYACTNELRGTEGVNMAGIGTFCHEYGHVLGLPDIYSTTSSSSSYTPGSFEVMDRGSYNNDGRTPPQMSSYDKFSLGWLNPRILTAAEDISLKPLEEGEALLIQTEKNEEYFMLENRQQKGWDAHLPGHGMLIWHIDFDQDLWIRNKVNTDNTHQRIDLIEADGVVGDDSRAGDPFPGSNTKRNFTATSTPAMTTWIGVDPDMPITDIHEVDGLITFKVKDGGESLDAPVANKATEVGPTSFVASWSAVNGVHEYMVDLCQAPAVIPFSTLAVSDATSVVVTGLLPSTDYTYTVRAIDGERVSPNSNTVAVTTLDPTFDLYVVESNAATNITSESFDITWNEVKNAAGYELSVYYKEAPELSYETADFTTISGNTFLPEGWSSSSTTRGSLNGYSGESAPALRLLNNNDRLSTPILDNQYVSYLSFWVRGNGTDDNASVSVEAYVDGKWETCFTTKPVGRDARTIVLADDENADGRIPDFARSARIVFNKEGNSGSIFIDDVKMGFGSSYLNVPVQNYDNLDMGNVTSTTVTGLNPLSTYYYTVRAYNADKLYCIDSAERQVKTTETGSVSAVAAEGLTVARAGSALVLSSAVETEYAVYSVAGTRVAAGTLKPGNAVAVNLASGAYIVVTKENAVKVMM